MEVFIHVLWSLVPASLLAALALYKRALTRGGLLLAWLLAAIISYCGGFTGFLALTATFVFTILAGKLSGKIGAAVGAKLHAKTGKRDAVQIVCNVLTGALMLVLKAVTGWDGFLFAYGGAMAASLADSMASELGVLSRRSPRDICTLKPVEKGLSGGVTPLGLGCSLIGAAIIGGICAGGYGGGRQMFLCITLAGALAALADSVLGSALQVKYRCTVCAALTEKPLHCGERGRAEKGLPFVTNDVVNFLNNCIGAAAAMLCYYVF